MLLLEATAPAREAVAQDWTTPATLVPLIVSLVALGGVMLSNRAAGRREERRRAQDLRNGRAQWLRDLRTEAYFEGLRWAADAVARCSTSIRAYAPVIRHGEHVTHDDEVTAKSHSVALEDSLNSLFIQWAKMSALGEAEVASAMLKVATACTAVEEAVSTWWTTDRDHDFGSFTALQDDYREATSIGAAANAGVDLADVVERVIRDYASPVPSAKQRKKKGQGGDGQ